MTALTGALFIAFLPLIIFAVLVLGLWNNRQERKRERQWRTGGRR